VLDVTIFGHVVSNRQETIGFLRDYLECLHDVFAGMLTEVFLREEFDYFDEDGGINLTLPIVDALLLA